jgi:hypothetical protein
MTAVGATRVKVDYGMCMACMRSHGHGMDSTCTAGTTQQGLFVWVKLAWSQIKVCG